MNEEFLIFLENANAETTLDKIQENCHTQEELDMVFQKIGKGVVSANEASPGEKLPLAWKKKALDAFAFVPIEKITVKDIQIKLNVGYHLATQIKDWLVKIK